MSLRSFRGLVFACMLCLVLASAQVPQARIVEAAGTLDQQQLSAIIGSLMTGPSALGQIFPAGLSGNLDQIDLHLQNSTGSTDLLTLQIRATSAGSVTSTVLATETFSATSIPVAPTWYTVTIDPPVPVIAGTQYAVVLIGPFTSTMAWRSDWSNPYAGGNAVTSNNNGSTWFNDLTTDLSFRTYVTIPTPPSPSPSASPSPSSSTSGSSTSPGDDDSDSHKQKKSDEGRHQAQHTNQGNREDIATEGNVLELHLDGDQPYVLMANRDGVVTVRLLCGKQCPTLHVGDYVQIEGEKQNEQLYDATDISIVR